MSRQRLEHIDKIVIHYTATPPDRRLEPGEIDRWHRERGWDSIGYHFVVHQDGSVEKGRPITKIGSHVQGHNRGSIGVVWVGGGDGEDTRTLEQRTALYDLIAALRLVLPRPVEVVGHRDLAATLCPGGDYAREEYN